MLIWTVGFMVMAFIAALLGFHVLAAVAAGLAVLTFVVDFFAGLAFVFWRLLESRGSTPHL